MGTPIFTELGICTDGRRPQHPVHPIPYPHPPAQVKNETGKSLHTAMQLCHPCSLEFCEIFQLQTVPWERI